MPNLVQGQIDIVPPLAWSEVQPTGFMVMSPQGFPTLPGNRLTALVPSVELVSRPEGTLQRFTFPALTAATPDIPDTAREAFRAEVAAVIAAFPTHVFGGTDRVIRFRGDALDDQWRIRLDASGTVQRQVADLTWNAAPAIARARQLTAAEGRMFVPVALPSLHCGRLDDHAPHRNCQGGPYAAPGNTSLRAATE